MGAGVAGLTCAVELAERGADVEVVDRGERLGAAGCSWYAGGMLAPWCELESAEPLIAKLGTESIAWWRERLPGTALNGSLVVAHGRDAASWLTSAVVRSSSSGSTASASALSSPIWRGASTRRCISRTRGIWIRGPRWPRWCSGWRSCGFRSASASHWRLRLHVGARLPVRDRSWIAPGWRLAMCSPTCVA